MARSKPDNETSTVSEADSQERVEMANSDNDGSWDKDIGVYERVFRASREVAVLELDVTVKQKGQSKATGKAYEFSYKGISHHQTTHVAKETLIKNGVKFSPYMDKDSLRIEGNKTLVWVEGAFFNVDKPKEDNYKVGCWGEATDNQGQGVQKAYSNAVKQILQKELNMTTFEEAETEDVEHVPENKGSDPESTQKKIQAWASGFKRSLENCSSLKEHKSLVMENKHMLEDEDVSEVTKRFFQDLIAEMRDYHESNDEQAE